MLPTTNQNFRYRPAGRYWSRGVSNSAIPRPFDCVRRFVEQPIFDLLYLGATLMLLIPSDDGEITFEFVSVYSLDVPNRRAVLQPVDRAGNAIVGAALYDVEERILQAYAILDDEWQAPEE